MYNLSEIMKTSHKLRREYYLTKSEALREAWAKAKRQAAEDAEYSRQREARLASTVSASELQSDDVITIEYGDYGNVVTCTVESVRPWAENPAVLVVNAVSVNGLAVEFCAEPEDRYEPKRTGACVAA
jgi:hypothetical protein